MSTIEKAVRLALVLVGGVFVVFGVARLIGVSVLAVVALIVGPALINRAIPERDEKEEES